MSDLDFSLFGAEHVPRYLVMTSFWLSCDTYQSRADRRTPRIVFERVG